MFSKQQKYYFDLDGVKVPHEQSGIDRAKYALSDWKGSSGKSSWCQTKDNPQRKILELDPLGKNPGDVFTIPTCPMPEAHFAVFPEKLCEKPIKAGCPESVCKKCGKVKEKIIEKGLSLWEKNKNIKVAGDPMKNDNYKRSGPEYKKNKEENPDKFIGYTDCGCNAGFQPGIVLDPFSGSGTTLFVAKELQRKYIGIELNPEYIKIAERRLVQQVFNFNE